MKNWKRPEDKVKYNTIFLIMHLAFSFSNPLKKGIIVKYDYYYGRIIIQTLLLYHLV